MKLPVYGELSANALNTVCSDVEPLIAVKPAADVLIAMEPDLEILLIPKVIVPVLVIKSAHSSSCAEPELFAVANECWILPPWLKK